MITRDNTFDQIRTSLRQLLIIDVLEDKWALYLAINGTIYYGSPYYSSGELVNNLYKCYVKLYIINILIWKNDSIIVVLK